MPFWPGAALEAKNAQHFLLKKTLKIILFPNFEIMYANTTKNTRWLQEKTFKTVQNVKNIDKSCFWPKWKFLQIAIFCTFFNFSKL